MEDGRFDEMLCLMGELRLFIAKPFSPAFFSFQRVNAVQDFYYASFSSFLYVFMCKAMINMSPLMVDIMSFRHVPGCGTTSSYESFPLSPPSRVFQGKHQNQY